MGEGERKMLARRNVPAPAELARTHSDSDSALTAADVQKDMPHRDAYAPPGLVAWTDEKHNSYIRSLEASFIYQLHRSINLCNSPLKIKCKPYSLDESHLKRHTSSCQITVLCNGRWQKINKRNELPTESTADSHFVGETPEVSGPPGVADIHCEKECKYLQQALPYEETYEGNSVVYLARKLGKHPFGRNIQDSAGDTIDYSGQNFIDGNVGEKSTSVAVAKRLKTVDSAGSINDQVVPLGVPDTQDIRNVSQDALARDRQEQPEGLFVRHG